MIINNRTLREFNRQWLASEKADFKRNMAILEAMYQEAVELHCFPPKDLLEGIEIDIKIARVVNSV